MKKKAKIIGGIFIVLIILVFVFIYTGSLDNFISNQKNMDNELHTLTVEKIENFKVASNMGNDYFIGSTDEQSKIVDLFVEDNSVSDSVYLYIAANTAELLNRPKDAMFLFYAAQLRKSFDYKRFKLSEADGNNIQTYLEYLNFSAGQNINPLAIQNPELFSEAIRMIEVWETIPVDDYSYYSIEVYGEVKVPKNQWKSIASEDKESFLNEFAYKQEKMFKDPKTLKALQFIQDYNFGKIPSTPENEQKYQEHLEIINSIN
jgi:hypothetical protein